MPVMCIFRAPGLTPADYDNVRTFLDWEADPPPGGLAHFISFHGDEAVEVDIWASRRAFKAYYKKSFKPALRRFGLHVDEPKVLELHNLAVAESIASYLVAHQDDATTPPPDTAPDRFGQGPLLHGPAEGYVLRPATPAVEAFMATPEPRAFETPFAPRELAPA